MILINYFKEIESIIETTEVNKKARTMIDNSETSHNFWNIGRLIVEAQGGEARARYGSSLIRKWSVKYVEKYGNSYNETNLKRFRKFFVTFPKGDQVGHQLNWSHIRHILPLKTESERNYYINQVILNNLSKNDLISLIKSKAYDRLSYKDKEHIKLITDTNKPLTIEDMIKDPIIIKVDDNTKHLEEKALHKYIINMLENKFLELGTGFTLAGHEYKINVGGRTYKIDLLFFNYELNAFVVVEVETKEIRHSDISQLQFYVNYIDRVVKKVNHNKTIGVLIVRKNNSFVIEYTTSNDIYVTTYELVNN